MAIEATRSAETWERATEERMGSMDVVAGVIVGNRRRLERIVSGSAHRRTLSSIRNRDSNHRQAGTVRVGSPHVMQPSRRGTIRASRITL